jgi:U6 snRNA-associated Sm-like protein LSm1
MLTWLNAGNIQLMDTVERYYHTLPAISSQTSQVPSNSSSRKLWGEISRGLYLIRGENVAYLGEIDLDLEDDPPAGWEKVEAEEIHRLDKGMREQREKELKSRNKSLRDKGLEREMGEEVIFV